MLDGKPQLNSLSFGVENSDQYVGSISTKLFSRKENKIKSTLTTILLLNLVSEKNAYVILSNC
jgi:hypothetical protein